MIDRDLIIKNLDNCLTDTSFLDLPNRKVGKVRDTFDRGDDIVLVTTDRQSAFDRVLAAIPFKGQVLNQVSAFWFENTKDIVPNHVKEITRNGEIRKHHGLGQVYAAGRADES